VTFYSRWSEETLLLFANFGFLAAAVITGAIRRWKQYYPTVLYVSFCNLLYVVLAENRPTWAFYSPLLTPKASDLLNTFLLLPSTTMLYLYFFPESKSRRVIYYLLWIAGFSALEYIWQLLKLIRYDHGWNLLWSVAFYFAMFFAIRLHQTSLGKALLFSLGVTVFLVFWFRIPIWK
jgi:hypothetical protein